MRKAAALLIALLCPAFAFGGEFDAASSKATKSSARALAWSHDLGGGADRILTVGVTVEDNQDKDPGLSVTFDGVPMSAVPGGIAAMTCQKRMLRTQLFYLLDTLAFYVNRNSVNFDFFLSSVDVERTVP